MQNQFYETKHHGFFKRIGQSIVGIIAAILFLIIASWLIFWNEGRANLGKIAQKAEVIQANIQSPKDFDQKMVAITGTFETQDSISDIFLKPCNFIAIEREVKMYAWEEKKETQKTKHIGGSETEETIYTYNKVWTNDPQNSDNFKKTQFYNPPLSIQPQIIKTPNLKIGIFDIDVNNVQLPDFQVLNLNNQILKQNVNLSNSNTIYKGNGSLQNPQIGDVQISYQFIPNPLQNHTIIGKLDANNKKIFSFIDNNDNQIFRIFKGTKDDAIKTLKTEHSILTWFLRILGFIFYWIAFAMLFEPISVIMDIIPLFGTITRSAFGFVSFLLALVSTILMIILSLIIHNILYVSIILLIGYGLWYYQKNKRPTT